MLNLIKSLSGQYDQSSAAEGREEVPSPAATEDGGTENNVLVGIIERHERISNRIKNNMRKK